jgi:hypothetical protein
VTDLEEAWRALHAATPAGWFIERPKKHPELQEWLLYAFDPTDRPYVGIRRREWIARAPTELGVLREMARCLAELREGRVPE